MTLGACIQTKAKAGQVSKIKGKAARDRFHAISQALIKEGEHSSRAYALAADAIVKEARDKAARAKHRLATQVAVMQSIQTKLAGVKPDGLAGALVGMVDDLDFNARSINSMAQGRLGEFLRQHSANWKGEVTDKIWFRDVLNGLFNEPTSSPKSRTFSEAIKDLNEWFRTEMNAAGFSIGKHENWGLPHSHNAVSIGRAGFEKWRGKIEEGLDWTKMTDPRTGERFRRIPPEGFRREFLRATYDNIVYGKASKEPSWVGKSSGNQWERSRVLEFRDSDAWLKYNDEFGNGDPFNTLMGHVDRMSRDLAMAKAFGPDPDTAIAYAGQVAMNRAREADAGQVQAAKIKGGAALAANMVRFMKGGAGPNGYLGAMSARFFSTTRKMLNAALLDRAIVISVPSDLNSARMAAKAIGMNPGNVISKYTALLQDAIRGGGATTDDLLRVGHIADSLANPGVTMARYQQEYPAAAWAEHLSNGAMKIQGMNAHTDNLRMAFKHSFGGHLASVKDLAFDALPDVLKKDMADRGGITAQDWDDFRLSGGEFTASNGATFLDPLYWREASSLDPDRKNELWLKMQSYVEKWTELAVPTGSLIAKGVMDPISYGLAPGSAFYELAKSAGMFKSFVGAFVVNQSRMVNMQSTVPGKVAYVAELVGTSTLVGALAMQVGDMLMGRDPQPMDDPNFWFRAVLRGGGLGPVGDILATGSASWGGGLGSYVSGPIPQFATDTMKLTTGNLAVALSQLISGDEISTGFGKDLANYVKRYTPMGQSPILAGGSAFDRMIVDQLWMALDPGALDALNKAAKLRENNYGNKDAWGPGGFIPQRLPNPAAALGG